MQREEQLARNGRFPPPSQIRCSAVLAYAVCTPLLLLLQFWRSMLTAGNTASKNELICIALLYTKVRHMLGQLSRVSFTGSSRHTAACWPGMFM